MGVRVKHIGKGYEELHRHPAAQADLVGRAKRVAAASGVDGVVVEPSDPIRKRNRVAVIALAGDPRNQIIRALDAGR